MIRGLFSGGSAALLGVGLLLGAQVAVAQPVMPSVSMPPPPSSRDRIGPDGSVVSGTKAARKPARKAAPKQAEGEAPERRSGATSGARPEIDTRAAAGEMQLEDDPRARPVMQNGRAGVGMRF